MQPTKRPGRPAGTTKASGAKVSPGRPPEPQDIHTAALVLRLKLLQARLPAAEKPTDAMLARMLSVSLATYNRRKAGAGSFSAAQLAAGNAYCDERKSMKTRR